MTGWLLGLALATAPTTGAPTGTPVGAVTTSDVVTVWSAVEIDAAEAVFVEVDLLGCDDIEARDGVGDPVPSTCTLLGPTPRGWALMVGPEGSWPVLALRLAVVGEPEPFGSFAVVSDPIGLDVEAVAVNRTVSSDGVSLRVCREGPVAAVALGATEPTEPDLVLGPDDEIVYYGASDGSWPEASPGLEGRFWSTTWNREGGQAAWVEDPVTLASAGMVRTDFRLGFDASNPTNCPSPTSLWTLGEEVEAQGGTPPSTPDEEDDKKGCGCASTEGAVGWFWVVGLGLVGRRYQWPPRSKSTST